MTMHLRTISTSLLQAALFASLLLGSLHTAMAQDPYPSKPIRMIVPLAAGSAVDGAARILTAKMAQNMGQPIVIENLAGSSGLIGADRLAKAAPDGYTIGGVNDSVLTMIPHIYPNIPWNALKDFDPISLVATIEWGIVVADQSPYKTLNDFIAAAKASPGKINYGSGGNGRAAPLGPRVGRSVKCHATDTGATGGVVSGARGHGLCSRRISAQRTFAGSGTLTAAASGQPDASSARHTGLFSHQRHASG